MSARSIISSLSRSVEWRDLFLLGRKAFAWWLGELEQLLPQALRPYLRGGRNPSLVLELSRPTARFLGSNGEVLAAGTADAATIGATARVLKRPSSATRSDIGPVVIILDQSLAIVRSITLPTAATGTLSAIIKHQLPRLVPLAANDVVSVYEVVSRQAAAKTMRVRITLVKKTTLNWAQDLASSSGLQVQRVVVEKPDSEGAKIRSVLWRPSLPRGLEASELLFRHKIVAGVASLLAIVVVIHVIRITVLDNRISAEVADLQHQAADVQTLDEKLRYEKEQLTFLQTRSREASAADVLARLTVLLPSDVSLTQFTYRSGAITCVGKAHHAASLIDIIEGSPVFRDPHFTSATTPSADGSAETFELAFSTRE